MVAPVKLVDQFCDAVQAYLDATREHPENVAGFLMSMLGGVRTIKGHGALSREELARMDPQKVRGVDVHGRYDVKHLRRWMHHLADDLAILDIFLVPAVVRFYENWQTNRLLRYEDTLREQQDMRDHFRRLIESKQARDEFYELARKVSPRYGEEDEDDEAKVEALRDSLRHLESMNMESIGGIRDKLQAWRDYTREIVSDENVKRYLRDMAMIVWRDRGYDPTDE